MKILLLILAVIGPAQTLAASPDGPSQQCRDDAGPPWSDDTETFGTNAYSAGTPALPALNAQGQCPPPLAGACADKNPQRAFLEGPVQCGGKGWFCRIIDQDGWSNPDYNDRNFAHCNATDADERDNDGHCHGSDVDNVYGWWVRDHWFRGYAGTLHCCCDWEGVKGLTNRCDYRKEVKPAELSTCRDANEEHNKGYEGTCAAYAASIPFQEPVGSSDQCWTIYNFADINAVRNPNPILVAPPTTGTTTGITTGTGTTSPLLPPVTLPPSIVMPATTSPPSLSPPSSVAPEDGGDVEEDKEEEEEEEGEGEEEEEEEEDEEEDCDEEGKEEGEGEDEDEEWDGDYDKEWYEGDKEWHEEEGDKEWHEGEWLDAEHNEHEEKEEGHYNNFWRDSNAFRHWFRQRMYSSANRRGRL